jgi:type III secretion protein L
MDMALLLIDTTLAPHSPRPWLKAGEYARLVDAQAVLDAARTEAERLRTEATAEFEAARRSGYEKGLAEAAERMAVELAAIGMHSAAVMRGLEEAIARTVSRTLADAVQDIPADRLYERALKKASRAARTEAFLTLRVPPQREEAARAALAAVLEEGGFAGAVELAIDPGLPDLACVLESEAGTVSAGLDVQLAALGDAVAREVARVSAMPRES